MKDAFWTWLTCWIQHCHPLIHTTTGCRSAIENILPVPIFGIPPRKLHHLWTHQQLLSELHETCTLDTFDVLNPAVASAHPYNHCLSLRHWKDSPPFRFSEFRSNTFIPHKDHQHYSQKIREGSSLDLFDALNPTVASFCPYGYPSWLRHWQHSPPFWFSEFRPNNFIPHKDHHQLLSEFREGGSLDLFNALNPTVASVCPYHHLLWLCHWKYSPTFPILGIPPQQVSPPVDTPILQSEDSWGQLLRPIPRAESSRSLCLSIQPLVVTPPLKIFSHFPIFRIPPQQLYPP